MRHKYNHTNIYVYMCMCVQYIYITIGVTVICSMSFFWGGGEMMLYKILLFFCNFAVFKTSTNVHDILRNTNGLCGSRSPLWSAWKRENPVEWPAKMLWKRVRKYVFTMREFRAEMFKGVSIIREEFMGSFERRSYFFVLTFFQTANASLAVVYSHDHGNLTWTGNSGNYAVVRMYNTVVQFINGDR